MITSHDQKKVILAIVAMSFLMFTATFALAVSGGRPLPGSGCSPTGEMLNYTPPPYKGTVTIKWFATCVVDGVSDDECVFMDGNLSQLGNNECQASFSDFPLWSSQDPVEFMHFHPNGIIGLCNQNLRYEFPCHCGSVPIPGKGYANVAGIELISVGNIQYIANTDTYKAFTASAVMMAVTDLP